MKKILIALGLLGCLTACSSTTQSNNPPVQAAKPEVTKKVINGAVIYSNEPNWRFYEQIHWSNDYQGLVTEINKISMSDTTVVIHFKITNTTKNKFVTLPSYGLLDTSTDEKNVNALYLKELDISGEVAPGTTKEGTVHFTLEGKTDDIKWVSMKWDTSKGAEGNKNPHKHYNVKLNIPQQ